MSEKWRISRKDDQYHPHFPLWPWFLENPDGVNHFYCNSFHAAILLMDELASPPGADGANHDTTNHPKRKQNND